MSTLKEPRKNHKIVVWEKFYLAPQWVSNVLTKIGLEPFEVKHGWFWESWAFNKLDVLW